MKKQESKVVTGEVVPHATSKTLPAVPRADGSLAISSDGPVRLWWSHLLAQSEERRWRALEAAIDAKSGAHRALRDYERSIGELDDIERLLETDRMAREHKRQEAELTLKSMDRKRMEEEIAFERAKQELERVKGAQDAADADADLRQLQIAAEKLALRKHMSGLERDIKKIEDPKSEKRLHPDAKRFEDMVDREDQILMSLRERELALMKERGGEKNLTDADRANIEKMNSIARTILRS